MSVLLYTHGLSLNAIAKIVGTSTPAVLKWVKHFAKHHCDMPESGESVIVELDEMWHYLRSGKLLIINLDALSIGNVVPEIVIH